MAIAVDWVPLAEVEQAAQAALPGVDPPQHSPPDFYIVYASLLI
jgi:hypothetical protein